MSEHHHHSSGHHPSSHHPAGHHGHKAHSGTHEPGTHEGWVSQLRETFSLTLVLRNLRWLGEPFIWLPAMAISMATLGAWVFWKNPDRWTNAEPEPDKVDWLSILESQPDDDSVAADIDSSNVLATELTLPQNQRRNNRNNRDRQNEEKTANNTNSELADILQLLSGGSAGPVGSRSRGGEGSGLAPRAVNQFLSNDPRAASANGSTYSVGGSSTMLNGNGTTTGQPVSPLQAALDRLYLNNGDGSSDSSGTTPTTSTNTTTPTVPVTGSSGTTSTIGSGTTNPALPNVAVPNAGAGNGNYGGFGSPTGYPSYGSGPATAGSTLPKIPTAPMPGYGSTGSGVPLNAGYNTVPNSPAIAPPPSQPAVAPEPVTQPSQSNIGGRPVRTFSNPW